LPPELVLLAQICTKSFVGWGFAPDPTGGAYSAPPDPLAGLGVGLPGRGRGRGGKGRGGGRWDWDPSTRGGKGGEGNGGKDGGRRVGKGCEGREGEGEEISIHGLKLVAPPMGSTRLAVSRGQQTWYHSTCYI